MSRIQIKLADTVFAIDYKYDYFKNAVKDYIVESDNTDCILTYSDKDIYNIWSALPTSNVLNKQEQFKSLLPVLESKAINKQISDSLSDYSALLMHGAVVTDGDRAYIFTAPSSTGKTTRAKLIVQAYPELHFLNGDKPIIRVDDEQIAVYDSPWRGKEGYGVNEKAKLQAIFILERANEDSIRELSFSEAFSSLIKQIYIPNDPVKALKTIELIKKFDGKVKIYSLRSTPTYEAVHLAYETAKRHCGT